MIHISNLRKESLDGWTRLIVDITDDGMGRNYLPESVMWLAVRDEDAHMLADNVCDAFVLIPLYYGMYYKQDVHIHGFVSKKLYKNVMKYLQRILCDFSDKLSRINITVDGFREAEADPNARVIGTGISCGVDSLATIYNWYVKENDPDFRINGLFFLNAGWHGYFDDEDTEKLFLDRYALNKPAADELNLPVYLVDSNFHAFSYRLYPYQTGAMGYLANYSCILGLQRAIKKYYVSSTFSYSEIMMFGNLARDDDSNEFIDFNEFSESYSVPLIQTEQLELVIDGCQIERSLKTELISDWDITQKYLTPCMGQSRFGSDAHNCTRCPKCLRTLLVIEAMDKLEDFAGVFDIGTYSKISYRYKCETVLNRSKNAFMHENYNFCKAHGLPLPSPFAAKMYFLMRRLKAFLKRFLRKINCLASHVQG